MMNRSRIDPNAPDLAALRAPLEGAGGPRYWRSLEELAGTAEFQAYLEREFPENAAEWADPSSRRHFLKLMGASLALAGVSGCAYQSEEKIVPYVKSPEEIVPGKPLYYASALTLGGYALGVLVESHMGRPTKVEGNPDHPASLGATDPFAQAEPLTFYDPDRSQVVTFNARVSTWNDLVNTLIGLRTAQLARKGAGLRVLTETVTSPTLAAQLKALLEQFPEARWHVHDPVGRDNARAGSRLAFGEEVEAVHNLAPADVILSLDSDFLAWGPGRLADARAFAARRESVDNAEGMNRLYVAEATPTITGATADNRLAVAAGRVGALAADIARGLGITVGGSPGGVAPEWVNRVVADLKAKPGRSLVLVGETQPPEVHALGHAINDRLKNVGATITYIAPVEATPPEGRGGSLRELARDMDGGKVDLLLILGGNPAYTAPADVDFETALKKLDDRTDAISVRLGLYEDETSNLCDWHVPEAHALEGWGDARAFDGTATVQQPMIAPLYGGKTASQLLAVLLGEPSRAPMDIVKEYWKGTRPEGDDFDAFWRQALHDGVVPGTKAEVKQVTLKGDLPAPPAAAAGELELVFRPDPTVWDGRYANNGWLQELPKPITKLTWDNALYVGKATAGRLKLANEDLVTLKYRGRTLVAAVWITPGQADGTATLSLGYGRDRSGRVGNGQGFDAYAIRTADSPWFGAGLEVAKVGKSYRLASTQLTQTMLGRDLIRTATVAEYKEAPDFASEHDRHHAPPQLTIIEPPEPLAIRSRDGVGNAWGMSINLNTCIGCNACVAACVAENNIPVVGKEEVLRGRNMHWIRIDTYFEGEPDAPKTHFQPVPCMQCENAPCELVCPVAATVHSAEGLNDMVYNRCVGTRYCSNNCPYKVRRFNFFQYADHKTPSLKMMRNPDVTVRSRGVMEKCTYCVQRISAARIAAEIDGGRAVRYGEVETACQGACPTRAIVFGNLNDRDGEVYKLKQSPRDYSLLAELNTRPRTTYLARLTNPNPEIKAE